MANKPADRADRRPDPEPRETVPRLSITLTDDGKVDWERMHDKTKKKVRELFPPAQAGGGPAALGSSTVPDVFNEQWCGMLYDALGQIEVAIAMRTYHCTIEQARVLVFSDADKRMLAGPTSRVLNKYAGTMFTKYGDEAALATLIGSIVLGKLTLLRQSLETAGPVLAFSQKPAAAATNETADTDLS